MSSMPKLAGSCGFTLLLVFALILPPSPVSAALMSKAKEREIGREVLRQVRSSTTVIDDPYVQDYLHDVGERLAESMQAGEFEMNFHVVADPRINAFAIPGGHIFVTSGTVLNCGDESELAGVIAHEMGHVEGRHIAYRVENAGRVNLATVAAVLAGVFLGSPELAAAATSFAVAGAQTKMLQYSQLDEEDADRRAVRALVPAGYDAWGMVRFMESLRKSSPTPEGIPAYMFTHPLPENRTAYLSASLAETEAEKPTTEELGPLWRAQARVLVQDPRPWGFELYRQRVLNNVRSADAHLGFALLLRKRGMFGEALSTLQQAERLAPGDPEILHEMAVTRLRQGQVDEGLELLESLRQEDEAGEAVLRDLGWAYLELDRGNEALAVYEELAEKKSDWPPLQYYRGLALGKADRPGEGHAALARYHRERGDLEQARRHYDEALRHLPEGPARDEVREERTGLGKKQQQDPGRSSRTLND